MRTIRPARRARRSCWVVGGRYMEQQSNGRFVQYSVVANRARHVWEKAFEEVSGSVWIPQSSEDIKVSLEMLMFVVAST